MARQSKKAQLEAQLEAEAAAVETEAPAVAAVAEAPAENPVIAKIKAGRNSNTALTDYNSYPVPADAPTEVFKHGVYTFEYFINPDNTCYPRLLIKGELFFSGWLCNDRDDAKSLLIALYYQHSGILQTAQARLPVTLMATHPLNKLIYPADNVGNVRESVDEHGNRTDLYPVVINPQGLALSGNSRLRALEDLSRATGVVEYVSVGITDGSDDLDVIISGNKQRVKTTLEILNEAMVAAAKKGKKNYKSHVREAYIGFGFGGGTFDAAWALKKFLSGEDGQSEFASSVSAIGEQAPTIANDLIRLHKAEKEGPDELAAELGRLARSKKADPINPENVYPGIKEHIALIRQHYTGETIPAIARELSLATPEIREAMIQAKIDGDKQKLSILRESLETQVDEAESVTTTVLAAIQPENQQPDWNKINDAEGDDEDEEGSAPIYSPSAPSGVSVAAPAVAPLADADLTYYQELRALNLHEADGWITNLETAAALNNAVGGVADVDPYGEKGQHLKADRIILPTDKPVKLIDLGNGHSKKELEEPESWGGGIHAKAKGLKLVTALPFKGGSISCFVEIMKRIESEEIGTAAFICDAATLFVPRTAAYFKALPIAWVLVSRESIQEATAGFGFEPSPFVHSNARFKSITAASWNERAMSFAIVYYGNDYQLFEEACGKYGVVSYSPKAAIARAFAFNWSEDEQGLLAATNDGVLYQIDRIGEVYYLLIDGARKATKYTSLPDVKKAALLDSIGGVQGFI